MITLRNENPKLNADYSSRNYYSQWERHTSATTRAGRQQRSPTSESSNSASSAGFQTIRRTQFKPWKHPSKEEQLELQAQRIQILEVKIKTAKTTLENLKTRELEFLDKNIRLQEHIQLSEKPDNESVKKLLRKYEKFRGGMTYLSENFSTNLAEEKQNLARLHLELQDDLDQVQRTVDGLDARLQERLSEIRVLINYKDKEYPVKSIRIAELNKEMDNLDMVNEDELFELEHVVNTELQKLAESSETVQCNIKQTALELVLSKMHPTLKEMAKQNQMMASEINFHTVKAVQIQKEIDQLYVEVKDLLQHPKTNVRLQVFPELFKYQTKCSPDMDIVLDVPKVSYLPI